MGCKDGNVPGKFPECGAIFMSNSGTKNECFDRKLFGLPCTYSEFVLSVKKGMTLFLFEFERRLLYGVFRAISDGEIDIQPEAYKTFRKKFPAQVRFTTVWNCIPLAEHEFHDAIKDNYYKGKKFHLGLNQDQVDKLMELFRFKKVSKNPERNVLRYADKPEEGHARFGDLRKTIRDRLSVVSKEDDDITSNEKIVEVNKLSCGRKWVSFKENRTRENDDNGDCGAWKKLLGNQLPLSLVGLKRKAAVGLHHMADLNNGHGMNNNLREIRGSTNQDNLSMMENTETENDIGDGYIPLFTETFEEQSTNQDNFMMENTETENDIGDGYIPLFTETFEEQYDEIGFASDDAMFQVDPSYSASGAIRYFEENQVLKTSTREGSVNPIVPKFIRMGSTQVGTDENLTEGHESHAFSSCIIPFAACKDSYREEPISKSLKKAAEPLHALKRLSSDTDLCVHEEDNDRMLCQTREDNRVGAFARSTFDLRSEPEPETNEKHGLNESVDKVMEMLEMVVSSTINKTANIKSVIKEDDISPASEIVDNKLPDFARELDADLAEESINEELVGEETELVDFKRRKRADEDKTECLGGAALDFSSKGRELVRHDVEKELTDDGDGVRATKITDMLCEITPLKDESCSKKVVIES